MAPTGVALRDVREQLYAAADRILLRAGPTGLTSRAVTAEAGVAKGVLHRHFTDFDDFLAGYVLARVNRMDEDAAGLRSSAGTGEVTANVAASLTALFESVAVAIVALITFRDELRETWPAGVPVLTEGAEMIAAYLADEQRRGRVAAGADVSTLSAVLIGSAHLLFADRTGARPTPDTVHHMVSTVLAGAL